MKEWVEPIVIAVILALIIRTFVVQAFKIPTGSMRTTLMEGDRILVNKFIYKFTEPKRGDVIVFVAPSPEDKKKDFIKRLVGLPGETIQISNGSILINNKPLEKGSKLEKQYYYFLWPCLAKAGQLNCRSLCHCAHLDLEINDQNYLL